MSNTFSRRHFLQYGMAAIAGGTALGSLPVHAAQAPAGTAAPKSDLVKGYCPFCQVRCTYHARVRNGKILELIGDRGNRWTGGAMCPKGLSIVELLNSPYRLVQPMLKQGSEWKTISYAEAIKKVGFVVHRGFFKTEEMDVADLFVPAAFGPESAGSHYGAEKQVVWRDKCVDAPGSCVPDWQFYRDIGRKLAPETYPDFTGPEELSERFRNTVPSWKAMSVSRMRQSPDGLIWPQPEEGAQERIGTVFTSGVYATENGKIPLDLKLMGAFGWTPPKGNPHGADADKEYPLVLTQGKVVTQWQQTMTNFAASLAQFSRGRYVLVHPDTAKPLGIAHGDTVRIKTATGSVEAVAELTASIRPGIIFTPSHFTGTSPHAATRSKPINAILPNYWDRVSAQFNGVGCALEKA